MGGDAAGLAEVREGMAAWAGVDMTLTWLFSLAGRGGLSAELLPTPQGRDAIGLSGS